MVFLCYKGKRGERKEEAGVRRQKKGVIACRVGCVEKRRKCSVQRKKKRVGWRMNGGGRVDGSDMGVGCWDGTEVTSIA